MPRQKILSDGIRRIAAKGPAAFPAASPLYMVFSNRTVMQERPSCRPLGVETHFVGGDAYIAPSHLFRIRRNSYYYRRIVLRADVGIGPYGRVSQSQRQPQFWTKYSMPE